MTTSVVLAILVTSLATFSSRFFGVITSEKIKENSKIIYGLPGSGFPIAGCIPGSPGFPLSLIHI